MSVRAALENALKAISTGLDTAWENDGFDATKLPASTPYQQVTIFRTEPVNDEISPAHRFTERGLMLVNLRYPKGAGPGAAEARAKVIRDAFPRGRSIPAGDTVITIERTPTIAGGIQDGDRYVVPVSIRFTAPFA